MAEDAWVVHPMTLADQAGATNEQNDATGTHRSDEIAERHNWLLTIRSDKHDNDTSVAASLGDPTRAASPLESLR